MIFRAIEPRHGVTRSAAAPHGDAGDAKFRRARFHTGASRSQPAGGARMWSSASQVDHMETPAATKQPPAPPYMRRQSICMRPEDPESPSLLDIGELA